MPTRGMPDPDSPGGHAAPNPSTDKYISDTVDNASGKFTRKIGSSESRNGRVWVPYIWARSNFLPLITQSGSLNHLLCAALGFSESEVVLVADALDDALGNLSLEEARSSTITNSTAQVLSVEISPNRDAIKGILANLQARLISELDPERAGFIIDSIKSNHSFPGLDGSAYKIDLRMPEVDTDGAIKVYFYFTDSRFAGGFRRVSEMVSLEQAAVRFHALFTPQSP